MAMNGEDSCGSRRKIEELTDVSHETLELTKSLTQVLDNKIDVLIETIQDMTRTISGRGMIPIDSIKWIMIFLLVFTFAAFFGVAALKEAMSLAEVHNGAAR